ncbi:PREDICTED: protein FAM205CP-like [Chinchilla lanigera]|uniref:Protein FAM205CP-like n=1 Tax=Chinchilla lanigera TaxID=34839 RepID=A0A8C2UKH6_CHILA|nr:PREDICTED: protein FAM205CP-like [Chinchilla lanigera]
MLSPVFLLWDVEYSLYTYGSIFIIGVIIWQVRKRCQKLTLRPTKNCCQHHQRVKQRSGEATLRAKGSSQKEAERLQKLVSLMESQEWLPQEGSVRRLLCADPSCRICNATALEIQQLLVGRNNQISPTFSKPFQSSSPLGMLSPASVPFGRSRKLVFQDSRELLWTSGPTLWQLTDQKYLTQSASQSTGGASVPEHRSDHLQTARVPRVFRAARAHSSPSLKEAGIHGNWKERTKNKPKLALMSSGAPEVDLENTMTFFSHWINPEVKDHRHKESVLHRKCETGAKSSTKEVEELPTLTKAHLEKTVNGHEAQPPCTEKGQNFF